MNMSPACTAPIQPSTTAEEQQHPRYNEYLRYRAAMSAQMVRGCTFALWLEGKQKEERHDGCMDADDPRYYDYGFDIDGEDC